MVMAIGIKRLQVYNDLQVVMSQVLGEYEGRDDWMKVY